MVIKALEKAIYIISKKQETSVLLNLKVFWI